ncbi:MAG: hypothetical protein JXA43_01395 [Candidatus Diapherotrites archaeon]|nr:hypothetical protein [Candidatus Diapherotrites archaeon]
MDNGARKWAILPNNDVFFCDFEEWSKQCDALGLPIVDFRGKQDRIELYKLTVEKYEDSAFEFRRLDTIFGLHVFSTKETFDKLNSKLADYRDYEENLIADALAPLFKDCKNVDKGLTIHEN